MWSSVNVKYVFPFWIFLLWRSFLSNSIKTWHLSFDFERLIFCAHLVLHSVISRFFLLPISIITNISILLLTIQFTTKIINPRSEKHNRTESLSVSTNEATKRGRDNESGTERKLLQLWCLHNSNFFLILSLIKVNFLRWCVFDFFFFCFGNAITFLSVQHLSADEH